MLITDIMVGIVGNRLREAMEAKGVDQTFLAKRVGVTQGAISQILNGKTRKSKHLPDIARELDVPLSWLMGLNSEMSPPQSEGAMLTVAEMELILDYRILSPESRSALGDIIRSMAITALIDSGMIQVLTQQLEEQRDTCDELLKRTPLLRSKPGGGRP